jgi:hypothetical protein
MVVLSLPLIGIPALILFQQTTIQIALIGLIYGLVAPGYLRNAISHETI